MTTEDAIGMVVGRIGGAVARNLVAAGHPVLGWARRQEALDDFVAVGGRAAASPTEFGRTPIVLSVVNGARQHLDAAREFASGEPARERTVQRVGDAGNALRG